MILDCRRADVLVGVGAWERDPLTEAVVLHPFATVATCYERGIDGVGNCDVKQMAGMPVRIGAKALPVRRLMLHQKTFAADDRAMPL